MLFAFISFPFISQNEAIKAFDAKANAFLKSEDLDSALVYAQKSLAEAEKINSTHFIIRAAYIEADIYVKQNKMKEAADHLYAALKLCKDTSENSQKMLIYNRLGLLNYQQGDRNKAKQFFKEEIKLLRETKDVKRLASSIINLSAMHRALKEYDSSFYLLSELKGIVNATKDQKLAGYFYNGTAIHYHSLYKRDSLAAQLDSAISNYERSLAIWLKMGDKEEAFRPLFNLGHAYHDKGQFVKALGYYKRVEELTSLLKLYREKMIIYGNMAEAYYDLKDYKQSSDYFRKYIEIKDSLNKTELADYTMRLDRQFQTEKQKETIQQQKLEIAEKELQISQQDKKVYLYLLMIVVVAALAVFIFVYFNFQKRVQQKTEEAKRKFFSNVVHEIRTPLSMIQAPLKILKNKHTTEDDKYNIEIAERNIRRLNELISQMLDISKIESTRYKLNESFGDLELFLNQLLGSYNKIAAEKNIILLHRFNLFSRYVLFDKDVLEKVIGNLLSNAIKYTPPDKQVGMDVDSYETEEGIKLTINVWDTGVGIAEHELEKIFSRFYRSSSVATTTKGAGIGLSLVQDLVDLLKGTIEVKSKEKMGSAFTVNFVLRTGEEKPTEKEAVTDEDADLLLIVEDDEEILNFNAGYLSKNGFSVLKARGGKEALELMEKTLPDLIVTDLMMPDMDGLQFLKKVRGKEVTDHIPAIVLSAKASSESRMEALKAGAQAYLSKPFLPDELLTLVVNQLEILGKKKAEFKEKVAQAEKTVEEKYVGTEPYTQKLFALIFQQLDNPDLSVEGLADLMATNRSHFQRKVKAITGITPSDLIRIIRLEKAREFLLAKKGNVTEVAYQSGFSSQSYFTKCFTQHFGVSPTQMLQLHKN